MKRLFIGAIFMIAAIQIQAQNNTKTDSILVDGVCEMCQERIEKYAYGKGVKFAYWNQKSSFLKLVYKTNKTSLKEISERVASIGHKTNLHHADSNAYQDLPDCCKYKSVEKH